jgi:hypothetical protein
MFRKIQGDQKVSVHLTITVQTSGAQRLFDHPVLTIHRLQCKAIVLCVFIYKTILSTIRLDKIFQILNSVLKSLKSPVHASVGLTHFTSSCPAVLIVWGNSNFICTSYQRIYICHRLGHLFIRFCNATIFPLLLTIHKKVSNS